VIRLKVPAGETSFTDYLRGIITFQNNTIDDQILLKSDGYPTYHLAVVVDDHDLAITHIIRGEEWIPSTPKHMLLYRFFGWELPVFIHLPSIVGNNKKKLSKRTGDTSLLSYRKEGYTTLAIINFLARLGFSPREDRRLYTLDELATEFSLDRLHKNPAIFDLEKLNWFNRLAKEAGQSQENLTEPIANILREHGLVDDPLIESQFAFIKEAAKRVVKTSDIAAVLGYLWQKPSMFPIPAFLDKYDADSIMQQVSDSIQALQTLPSWDETAIGNALREQQRRLETWPSRDFYQLITAAVSGMVTTPPLFASLALLGRDEILERLRTFIVYVQKAKSSH